VENGFRIHKAESRDSCQVILEKYFTRRLSRDQKEKPLQIGKFCEIRISLVESFSDIIESEIGLHRCLKVCEALIEFMYFLPL
jgi:hypothetical protein